jgi:hypothetical protein
VQWGQAGGGQAAGRVGQAGGVLGAGIRGQVVTRLQAAAGREVLWDAAVEVRQEVHRLVGGGVRQGVHWAVGVWREEHPDLRGGGLVGGDSGCKWWELGGRCFRMRLGGVMRKVLQDADSWSEASSASGRRGSG